MKICLFSDIHGNQYALDEFIKISSKLDIDLFIFCGDIFGYYYEPNKVISTLKTIKQLKCVKGNHDQLFLDICSGKIDENGLITKYGNSYKNIQNKISEINKPFIEYMPNNLKLKYEGKNIGVFHGSPTDSLNGRIYPDTLIVNPNIFREYDYVILGHTHYRMVRQIGKTKVINPGSLGQPRDKNGFSFATLSIPQGEVTFYEIHWDRQKLVKDIKAKDNENKKLIDILFRNEVY